jgi:hypothetical protein
MTRAQDRLLDNAVPGPVNLFSCELRTKSAPGSSKALRYTVKTTGFVLPGPIEGHIGYRLGLLLTIGEPRKATKRDPNLSRTLATIESMYFTSFEVDAQVITSLSETQKEKFAKGRALVALHPYVQEHIVDLTTRMGYPPLVIDLDDLVAHLNQAETAPSEDGKA